MRTVNRAGGRNRGSFVTGAVCGVGSAALFGLSAPLSKRLLPDVGSVMLAGLLYVGAGTGLTVVSLATGRKWPRLTTRDWGRLALIALVGGLVGPSLLMFGLRRLSGVAGSLLLNLEAVFTMALAVTFFGERMNLAEWFGATLIVIGAVVISYSPDAFTADWLGVLAVAGACLSWGLDNNLTQQVSSYDPFSIVQIKTLSAGVGNVLLALAIGTRPVSGGVLGAALVVGFVCYGISIVLDVYALRFLGAAREAVFFATAPFLGAVAAVPILGDHLGRTQTFSALLMAAGVAVFQFKRSERRRPDAVPYE